MTQVLDLANYSLSPYAVPVLLVASLIAALGFVVLVGERGSAVSISFWLLTVSAAIWLGGFCVVYLATDEAVAVWWLKAAHLGVVFIPTLVYLFTLAIVQRIRQHLALVLASAALSMLFYAGILTTAWFIQGAWQYPWGYYTRYGPLSIPFLAFFFTLMVISLRLYWTEYRCAASRTQRHRLRLFLLAFCVAYVGSVDYIACYGIPVYPFGYLPVLGFIILAAQAIWRYRLIDFTPAFAADKIVATMNDALIVCDAEGLIQFVNDAACSAFRYTEPDLLGKPVETLVHADPQEQQRLRAMLASETVQDQELLFRTKEGQPVDVSLSLSQLRQKNGNPAPMGTVLIARDIRDRKQASQELKRIQAMLVQAEKMAAVGQLASGTAHEVRNPLNVIQLGVDHLERALHLHGGQEAEVLAMIKHAIIQSNKIIRGMLDFSRPAELELKAVSLNDVISEAILLVEHQLTAHKVRIIQECSPDLPEALLDANRMKQVFVNLLLNAIQAMPDGGQLTIRAFSKRLTEPGPGIGSRGGDAFRLGERVLVCEIADTGTGIPKEHLEKIFDPFFTTKPPGEGTGLGLTITRAIVEQHGGLITFETAEGRGTTARIMLPLLSARREKATNVPG